MRLAVATKRAIDLAIEADQGSAFRVWSGRVLPHIGDAYREGEKPFRKHLGASLVGGPCARSLWYSFRWFTRKKFTGRLLRLFNRGHLEEGRFIAMLLMIGCRVVQQDAQGKQFTISDAAGHFGGSGDGVVFGCPDLGKDVAALLECKTHGEKSFKELVEKGVKEAKHEHFVQMQTYMRKMQLMYGLYFAVNKNTDEIHLEIVELAPEFADQYIERGVKIVWMRQAPQKLQRASPGYFQCRFCDHMPVCLQGVAPDRNCRTCQYSEPLADGSKMWGCNLRGVKLDEDAQYAACDQYRAHE